MNEILVAGVFIAQLLCSMLVKHKIWKYTPTLVSAALMCVTVVNASLGQLDPMALVIETMMILAGAFAAMLQLSIALIWKRMKDRK